MFEFFKKLFGSAQDRTLRRYSKIVMQVNEWDEKLKSLSDEQIKAKTQEFKERLKQGEPLDNLLPEAYGVVKNACRRMIGTDVHVSGYDQKWDMVPYDVQILGAIAMHHGAIAEMQTGEGKTLTAVMPLYLNALTGKPVHLVTVNDYLAHRDCQWVGSILRWLGLTTASLTGETPMSARKQVYEADVVYGTASEFGFDYLRDNSIAQSKNEQVQRGYYYAIVDEIDSILIDEARTPLIISGPVPDSRQMYNELKDGVAQLVQRQRDLCNRLATEARKVIDQQDSANPPSKEVLSEAFRKLWLVGKGTPNNKILKRIKEEPEMRAAIDKWDLHYYSEQNKEEKHRALAELFIIVDERANEYELTDKGIIAWDESSNVGKSEDFIMIDLGHEYALIDGDPSLTEEQKAQRKMAAKEEDAKRKERAHNLRQLLRGHLLMERDVDYLVQDDKIIIVDEHTGRPQPGRRFSDGLHQAIEAKEGVAVQKETQTYATITLQNFFRMYTKLSGMSGTCITEAHEFKEIYKLEVLVIPTYKPCVRDDMNDEIYMTEREKYNAILRDIKEVHAQGRPILIGTESVEVSEKLSRILKANKLEHTVLNAKNHEREAEIVAHAGRRAAITVSTNMAGRGTDIKLEKGVADVGGMFVIGTTRHQSRRIDRQLRGRCARLGDPGSSKFYISFEDSLLRLFASPTLTNVIQRFRPPEGEPISARILNKSIETAQKRVEQRNYTIRKHTLEYDDVMNKQRTEIYAFRNDILHTDDVEHLAEEVLHNVCEQGAEEFFRSRGEEGGWDPEGYRQWLMAHFPVNFEEGLFDNDHMEQHELVQLAVDKVLHTFREKIEREKKKIPPPPPGRENIESPVNRAMRNIMIREVDHLWQEHLLVMDHLRGDVSLRSVAQRDPLLEFKHEAFGLFDELSRNLKDRISQNLFRFEMMPFQPEQMQQLMSKLQLETTRSLIADMEQQQRVPPQNPKPDEPPSQKPPEALKVRMQPIVAPPVTARNDQCPCGSGKKYKKCCGAHLECCTDEECRGES